MIDLLHEYGAERGLPVGTTDAVIDRLFPTPDPLANDPVKWSKDRGGMYLWSKQRDIFESVRDNRYTAVQSCHGMGKSFTAAAVLAWWIDTHPPAETFIVWTAPRWPQVQAIIGRELRAMHKRIDLPGRITLDCMVYSPADELIGMGRKPADTDEHGFQGIHAKYVLIVVDEACGVPKQLWDAIESLMTNAHCRVLAIGNPDDPSAHFYVVCQPGSGYHVIKVSAFDTPNLTDEWIPDKLRMLLTSKMWIDERVARWGKDSMLYKSKVLGEFPDVSEDTLFPPRLILAMHNADLPGMGKGKYGLDVSRYGSDKTTLYRNRDGVVRRIAVWEKQSTQVTADLVAEELGIRGIPCSIDVVGVGAGVFDNLQARGKNVVEFNSSHQAVDPNRFLNFRAEAFWTMREDAELGLVDLDPLDLDLAVDLQAIKYKIVKGKVQIESKDEIKKRLGKAADGRNRSPDFADGAVIAYTPGNSWSGNGLVPKDSVKTVTHDLLDRKM